MHLLAIVLLGLLIGSLGLVSSLGIQQDGYSNINKKGKNPDFVCREIPKKQPRVPKPLVAVQLIDFLSSPTCFLKWNVRELAYERAFINCGNSSMLKPNQW